VAGKEEIEKAANEKILKVASAFLTVIWNLMKWSVCTSGIDLASLSNRASAGKLCSEEEEEEKSIKVESAFELNFFQLL
jgi:hypothetical protein